MLHLYAQFTYHDDAYLIGTRDSLIRLREAINQALYQKTPIEVEEFTQDGEGYALHLAMLDDDQMSNLTLPYSDPAYRDHPDYRAPSEVLDELR
jgi:hypothetical protein